MCVILCTAYIHLRCTHDFKYGFRVDIFDLILYMMHMCVCVFFKYWSELKGKRLNVYSALVGATEIIITRYV